MTSGTVSGYPVTDGWPWCPGERRTDRALNGLDLPTLRGLLAAVCMLAAGGQVSRFWGGVRGLS